MAEPDEDLVALILSALEGASPSELHSLSESLASDSSLQLQRLCLLLASPSRCLSIISLLDSLAYHHRRLLLARVTLRLVSRITDFLENSAFFSSPEGALASPVDKGPEAHLNEGTSVMLLELPSSDVDKEGNATIALPILADNGNSQHRKYTGVNAFANTVEGEQPCSSANSSQVAVDMKNCQSSLADVVQYPALGKDSASMHIADGHAFENSGAKGANNGRLHVELEAPFASDFNAVKPSLGPADCFHSLAQERGIDLDKRSSYAQSFITRNGKPQPVSLQLATNTCWRESFPNFVDASVEFRMGMSGEDDMDDLTLAWDETDAAFLFLFLWETQEQECQELIQKWSLDSFVYHLFIEQDMDFLVDIDRKAGRIKAPGWKERLQQYLQQHILQVGYGFPGVMASANLPPSLSAYIDTIGRFQRILESMTIEDSSEPKMPAASAAVLCSLPTTVIGLSSEDKGKVCIICKEELERLSVASRLPCMHIYHLDCISAWLKERNNCPVCRFEFPSDDYDHELQRKREFLRGRVSIPAEGSNMQV